MRNNNIITGLDIGTETTKALVVQSSADVAGFRVLAKTQVPSQGMRKGAVIEASRAQQSIEAVVDKAQKMGNRKISSVVVNIGGHRTFITTSKGLVSVSRADRTISEGDVDRVLEAAQAFSLPSNREILEVFPKEFIVDGEGGIKEPQGMEGVRLEAEVLVPCVFTPHLKKLSQAVVDAGLNIEKLVCSALASSRAVLSTRDKELGVAVLDIGAGTTGMAVFEERTPIHLAVFPVGSLNITNDIATILKCDLDTAEEIKLKFGSCLPSEDLAHETDSEDREKPMDFSQEKLVEIIEARVSEIFELGQEQLKQISKSGELPAGVVLTGGGANLPGIVELAKQEFDLPCRVGTAQGFRPSLKDPAWSGAAGLVKQGAALVPSGQRTIIEFLKRIVRIFVP